jgi:hypothetical protein
MAAMNRRRLFAAALLVAFVQSGCSQEASDDGKPKGDPAQAAALSDPIMVDTGLASQNKAEAAIAGGGPPTIALPPIERDPEMMAAARAEAEKLAGGAIETAPSPREGELAGADGVTPAQLAALVGGGGCAGKLGYSAGWATRLPAPLAIYPRGHLREAAGVIGGGCTLVIASFLTPVGAGHVTDFYYTRLRLAGLTAEHRLAAGSNVLTAAKGKAAYAVRIREFEAGVTAVDLVSGSR